MGCCDLEACDVGKIDPELSRSDAAHAFMMEDEDFADDGAEARNTLASGRPIYYTQPSTPPGLVVRESPDGRKDLLRVDADGSIHVVGPA